MALNRETSGLLIDVLVVYVLSLVNEILPF